MTLRFLVLCGFLLALAPDAAAQVQVRDLQDRVVDPLRVEPGTSATVLMFLSVDCPISNRYAPELRRIYDAFASRGVAFWLVYPNPAESATAIQAHMKAFGYPGRAVRDPRHALVQLAHATVSSETAILDAGGRFVYRGRIDDRFVDIGIERPAPTTHDLQDSLSAVLGGRSVPQAETRAVGCYLADLQ